MVVGKQLGYKRNLLKPPVTFNRKEIGRAKTVFVAFEIHKENDTEREGYFVP